MTLFRVLDISNKEDLDIFEREISINDELRYEQVGNIIYFMARPTEIHQRILWEFLFQLESYFRDKPCKVHGPSSGLDLSDYVDKLKEKEELKRFFRWRETDKKYNLYLDPDLMVICEDSRFEGDYGSEGFKGIPKLILEVFSPSTGTKDITVKKYIYETIGVSEYWIINKESEIIRFNLKNGKYFEEVFLFDDIFEGISSQIFFDLVIKFNKNKFDAEVS